MDSRALDRRKAFKTPPVAVDGGRRTQEQRRAQVLEDQKRRRLLRVDSARQLDQFADLNLGLSDDDDDEVGPEDSEPLIVREGVSHFASLLPRGSTEPPPDSRSPSPAAQSQGEGNVGKGKSRKKRKSKGRKRRQSKWANKCMYAELLEMNDVDPVWSSSWNAGAQTRDGLPDDLETAWVALSPIPVGKRCLSVTKHSAGPNGAAPNTTLRSRLLGKVILAPFPSPFPPNTILDCILDANWRSNGLLHILDTVRWKSQDVSGCEARFRFWWRDTRLLELPVWPAPPPHTSFDPLTSSSTSSASPTYRFPYPTNFLPVPYTTPTPHKTLLDDIIPRARLGRNVGVRVPNLTFNASSASSSMRSLGSHPSVYDANQEMIMQIDFSSLGSAGQESSSAAHTETGVQGQPSASWSYENQIELDVPIASDGILLYVGEAAYESGESPLSVWVPRVPFEESDYSRKNQDHEQEYDDGKTDGGISVTESAVGVDRNGSVTSEKESPLDVFERLVRRRFQARLSGPTSDYPTSGEVEEVEMES